MTILLLSRLTKLRFLLFLKGGHMAIIRQRLPMDSSEIDNYFFFGVKWHISEASLLNGFSGIIGGYHSCNIFSMLIFNIIACNLTLVWGLSELDFYRPFIICFFLCHYYEYI
jgi:hypothetical protein